MNTAICPSGAPGKLPWPAMLANTVTASLARLARAVRIILIS
jgi:hypothetical protein